MDKSQQKKTTTRAGLFALKGEESVERTLRVREKA
jgi:hypothetical protein